MYHIIGLGHVGHNGNTGSTHNPHTILLVVVPHAIYFLCEKTVQYMTIFNSKQMIISV